MKQLHCLTLCRPKDQGSESRSYDCVHEDDFDFAEYDYAMVSFFMREGWKLFTIWFENLKMVAYGTDNDDADCEIDDFDDHDDDLDDFIDDAERNDRDY